MTKRYAWYMLLILTAINFVNYVDRQIVISLGPFIRQDLELTYLQFGWLITMFMLIHSIASVPFGILSDRWIRRKIIALGVFFWSAATLASGLATNFAQLLAGRAAVGIGEAAYAPPANSLLSDVFPVEERARILGLFNVGMFMGGAAGLILGGVLGDWIGWRHSLFLVSAPGFLLAGLGWKLREPPLMTTHQPTALRALFRSHMQVYVVVGGLLGGAVAALTNHSLFGTLIYVCILAGAAAGVLAALRNRMLQYIFSGGIVTAFSVGALIVWMPQFVTDIRYFRPRDAGLLIGAVGVTGGLMGVMVGSYLADWLYVRWPWGRMATIGMGLILSSPFVMLALNTTNHIAMLAHFFLAVFFIVWYTGPIIAVIHDVVPSDVKATAQALYIFLIHLLGDTFSPPIVGWFADRIGLQQALQPLAILNVLGGVVFLVACRGIAREKRQGRNNGSIDTPELPRTGTTGL